MTEWRLFEVGTVPECTTAAPASHYDFHTWAWNQAGYRALLEGAGYEVLRPETWSIFQICLGRQP